MKFKWTLYRKIQVLIVFVLFFVYLSSNIIIVSVVNLNIKDSFTENTVNTATILQKNIEVLFSDALTILEYTKNEFEQSSRDDDSVRDYFEFISSSINTITNSYFAYNDGTFILEPRAEIPEGFDPREREWYKLAYKVNGTKWSEPYIDIATGDLVITAMTYVKQKDTDGVIGVDLNLERLSETISDSKISKHGFILLINEEGYIISDSQGHYQSRNIEDLNDRELMDSRIVTGVIETRKGTYYLRQLNRTDIRLLAFLPKNDVESELQNFQLLSSFILFISLFVALFITYTVTRKLTKPLEELKDTMNESILSGHIIPYEGNTNDEINSLIEGYNNMAKYVNEQNTKINVVTRELIESDRKLHDQFLRTAELAYTDYLTSLPNRVKFEEVANQMIEERERFALFYLDLDNFKVINDTYGHSQGDKVLEAISKRFDDCCSERYFVARLSGDEFGILVPIKVAKSEIKEKAKTLLGVINKPIKYEKIVFGVTGSIGISVFPDDAETFETLLSNADIAMFEAKEQSKNQFVIYNDQLKDEMIEKFNLENKLIKAVENNNIHVYYQPLVNYKTKKVDGFESLARWIDPDIGMIYPDVFIPLAEHNLYINTIGAFVLEESLRFGNMMKDKYGDYYEMNVNVSAVQLHLENFVEDVVNALKKYNYPPGFLNLEITESIGIESNQLIISKLASLHKLGVKISLDDFGTGYSSLNHLLSLSLTHLKIDRSLIVEAVKSDDVYRLIKGIVDFAHTIHLKVVAEGIEDAFMEQMMGHMTVDICQGYLYSRPVNEEDIIKYIDEYPV